MLGLFLDHTFVKAGRLRVKGENDGIHGEEGVSVSVRICSETGQRDQTDAANGDSTTSFIINVTDLVFTAAS